MFKYTITTIESSVKLTEAEQNAAAEQAKKQSAQIVNGMQAVSDGIAKIGEAMSKMFSGW